MSVLHLRKEGSSLPNALFCSLQTNSKDKKKPTSPLTTTGKSKARTDSSSNTSPAPAKDQRDAKKPESNTEAVSPGGATLARHILTKPEEAAAMWDSAFQSNPPSSEQFADAITFLHQRKQFNVAVEGMLSAIRNDRAMPWIYEVLPLEMKLADRPAPEISRVLKSRMDFATSDIRQMLITAAVLSRFEAFEEALAVCREATELNPDSPEPWLMGRSIADRAKNDDARVKFRCGILKHVWTEDFQTHHEEARKVINDLMKAFDQQNKSELAQSIRERFEEAAAIDLQVHLNWVGPADLDLLVTEPGGEKCSYRRRVTDNGGRLVHEEGIGDPNMPMHSETYICHTAPSGEYQFAVRFVLGKAVAGTAVLEIIQHAGTPQEVRSSRTIQLAPEDVQVKSSLTNGRALSR